MVLLQRLPTRRSPAKLALPREWFVPALVGVVATASFLPCRGSGARAFDALAVLAIASLFFLQGARLSRDAVATGAKNWRLHLGITSTTFVLFPLFGSAILALYPAALTPSLGVGLLFVCVLPSTVQSSIALTSIAGGEVAGAICAATGSNLVGIVLSPMLLALLLHGRGGSMDLNNFWKILAELLVPFIAGHALRPCIGQWAERNRTVLAITDRGSILIVVYTAFSAAVVHGIWHQLPAIMLAKLVLFDALLLAAVLATVKGGSRLLAMPRKDEVALVFCGSQKSVITGVPMAHLLFAGPVAGIVVLPIMIYHLLQLLVGAWLARRYAAGCAAPVVGVARGTLSTTAARRWQGVQTAVTATAAVMRGWGGAIVRVLRDWRERERQRRELSQLRPRDFGDLVVPPSLAVEESRHWPWQKSSPQWRTIRDSQGDGLVEERRPKRPALGPPARRVRSRLPGIDDELAIVLVFSLSGLDLSLWLLAKYATAGSAGLFSALPLQ
jgi:solute carrier family 10 (sodium/bile acid cotransporter), member 7